MWGRDITPPIRTIRRAPAGSSRTVTPKIGNFGTQARNNRPASWELHGLVEL